MRPPYYAVIFTSELAAPAEGYEETAERMEALAREQPGFLGFDSVRGGNGNGVTVSYWESLEAIRAWKAVREHREAQAKGRERWYDRYRVRIARVDEDYGK
jgi:heme-degrading monooxygenase HmoA